MDADRKFRCNGFVAVAADHVWGRRACFARFSGDRCAVCGFFSRLHLDQVRLSRRKQLPFGPITTSARRHQRVGCLSNPRFYDNCGDFSSSMRTASNPLRSLRVFVWLSDVIMHTFVPRLWAELVLTGVSSSLGRHAKVARLLQIPTALQ